MKIDESIQKIIESGSIARLLPVVADSKKEERATSSLLASFMAVPNFAQAVLSEVGAPVFKTSKITCLTEVVFKTKGEARPRPDGFIVITRGAKTWTAIVESKIGNAELNQAQIEQYIDIAKEVGANAMITLSNQFATLPTQPPGFNPQK